MGKQWAGGWRWALVVGVATVFVVALSIGQWIDGFSGTATAAQTAERRPCRHDR
jgi:hypothetical protein